MICSIANKHSVDVVPDLNSLSHQLVLVPHEVLVRAGLDNILSPAYQNLRSRFVAATQVVQGHPVTDEDFEVLDHAVLTGNGFPKLMKQHLGFPDASPLQDPTPAEASLIGSLYSSARAWTSGSGYDEGEARVHDLLRRASTLRTSDPAVLSMITQHKWPGRLPRSTEALYGSAGAWLVDKVESVSNSWAHRTSDEQFRNGEARYRNKVENTFGDMVKERMDRLKAELNDAELREGAGSRVWKIHELREIRPIWGMPTGKSKLFRTCIAVFFKHAEDIEFI
jgi:hypothetical protein